MLGMEREHPCRMIGDRVWEQLKAGLEEAKHSRAGAPARLSDRDFLEAVLYLNRVGGPWRDLPPELGCWHVLACRLHALSTLGRAGSMAPALAAPSARRLRPSPSSLDGLHNRARPPARRRSAKKTAATRLWGALGED
jgi:transposase